MIVTGREDCSALPDNIPGADGGCDGGVWADLVESGLTKLRVLVMEDNSLVQHQEKSKYLLVCIIQVNVSSR